MNKNHWLYYVIRIALVLFYPLWVLGGSLTCKTWEEFKDGASLPFKRWSPR